MELTSVDNIINANQDSSTLNKSTINTENERKLTFVENIVDADPDSIISNKSAAIENEWNQNNLSSDDEYVESNKRKQKDIGWKIPKFKCLVENCTAMYLKQWLLDDHIRKHNNERPFVCKVDGCLKTFTKEPHLKRHKTMVHESSCEQVCDVSGCGLVYNNKYSLKKHKNQVHNASKWPFFCNNCNVGFKKKWQLNQHNYKHTGEAPFKCTMCNLGFTVQRDLTKHSRNHKTYTCNCGEIFDRWSAKRKHTKTCSVQPDYVCMTCNKKFDRKCNYTAHIKEVHQESEGFNCSYMDCTRSYKYKKNLNFHILMYHKKQETGETACPECGKMFPAFPKFYITRHMKVMHNSLPKVKGPRATRKDKGKTKTSTAAVLAGLKLSQKEHIELLKSGQRTLTVKISKIDLKKGDKIEKSTENGISEKDNVVKIRKNETFTDVYIQESSEKLSDNKNMKQNVLSENVKNGIITKEIQTSVTEIIQNHSPPDGINVCSEEINNTQSFSDEILIACNTLLNKIDEYLA